MLKEKRTSEKDINTSLVCKRSLPRASKGRFSRSRPVHGVEDTSRNGFYLRLIRHRPQLKWTYEKSSLTKPLQLDSILASKVFDQTSPITYAQHQLSWSLDAAPLQTIMTWEKGHGCVSKTDEMGGGGQTRRRVYTTRGHPFLRNT